MNPACKVCDEPFELAPGTIDRYVFEHTCAENNTNIKIIITVLGDTNDEDLPLEVDDE